MGKTAGPEHNHFSIVEARAKGDNKVQCNYCNYTFVGGDSRMRTHLLGDAPALGVQRCTACPPAVLAEMMQLAAEKDADANKKRKLAALDQASASVVASNASTVASRQTLHTGQYGQSKQASGRQGSGCLVLCLWHTCGIPYQLKQYPIRPVTFAWSLGVWWCFGTARQGEEC